MVTPGLLPEADDHRGPSPLRWILPLVIVGLIVGVFSLLRERQVVLAKTEHALAASDKAQEAQRSRIQELEARVVELEKTPPPPAGVVDLPPPSPARAPDLRVLPPDLAAERLTQGLHELRSGRYVQAEACFLRAIPEGYLYLAISCMARGDVREAALFLARAMKADPQWLRRIRPRDLFGSAEEFERALRSLEERVRDNPLDGEAKTLLAYLHFHEKGPEYAKALLTEVAGSQPDDPSAKAFLEAVDKP